MWSLAVSTRGYRYHYSIIASLCNFSGSFICKFLPHILPLATKCKSLEGQDRGRDPDPVLLLLLLLLPVGYFSDHYHLFQGEGWKKELNPSVLLLGGNRGRGQAKRQACAGGLLHTGAELSWRNPESWREIRAEALLFTCGGREALLDVEQYS